VRSRGRSAAVRGVLSIAVVALLFAVAGLPLASAAGYPALPLAYDRAFLGNLSAPSLTPGSSGSISFSVANPLTGAISGAALTLQVYAFNAFPGNASSTVSVAGAPVLSNATASGASVVVAVGYLAAEAVYRGSVGVASSSNTPSGTFAVRTSLSFTENSTGYLLESRGWFTAAQWANATQLPNGSATLNLSRLGVSGVLTETAVLVDASDFPIVLPLLLVGAVILVGIGGWIYFRRGAASSSGTRRAEEDHQAPTAFGNKRTKDGD
jgi:hypothetical protein